ncbi:MAG TPA: hypothetical protein VNT27_13890 [Propionibacteriaceae bacterium]|nr:hypothetical protein [Propionibacteriaceae bacterium]
MELAGPPAQVPPPSPAFWAAWGAEQWSLVVGILGFILAVVVFYVSRHHQRKDARRTEEWKEHVAALRAILVDLTVIEKTLGWLSFSLLDQQANETLGRLKALTDKLNQKAADPRIRTKDREEVKKSASLIDANIVMVVHWPGPTALQLALDDWKRTDSTGPLYQVMTEMIDSAAYRRSALEALKARCHELREQVESLIQAANY